MTLQQGIDLALNSRGRAVDLKTLRIFEHLASEGDTEAQAWISSSYRSMGYLSGRNYKDAYIKTAIAAAEQAIRLNPKSAVAFREQSRNFMYSKRLKEARQSFATAFRLQPQHLRTYLLGADLFEMEKNPELAEKSLLKALTFAQTASEKAKVYRDLGYINLEKEPVAAISYYQASLQFVPNDSWAMNNLGIAYNTKGKWDDAIAILEKALSLGRFGAAESNLAVAYAGKATYLAKLVGSTPQMLKQAEELAMKALKLDSDNNKARGALGVIYLSQARQNQDAETLKRSLEYFHTTFSKGYSNSWLLSQFNAAQAMHLSQQMDKTRLPASAP